MEKGKAYQYLLVAFRFQFQYYYEYIKFNNLNKKICRGKRRKRELKDREK